MKPILRADAVPPLLFKYLKRRHAEALVRAGHVRIGTLYEYQNIELYGAAVGDQHEGLVSGVHYSSKSSRRVPPASLDQPRRVYIRAPGDTRVSDISIYATPRYMQFFEEWPDSYIYCVSNALSARLLRAFDADAVVEIREPLKFFQVLTRHLHRRLRIQAYFLGRCGYRSRLQTLDADAWPSLFVKPLKYRYQGEIRLAWLPLKLPINPVLTRCSELTKYVSLVDDAAINRPSTAVRRRHRARAT